MVNRVYVEKKPGFDIEAQQLLAELRDILGVASLSNIRVINRYDAEGISDAVFEKCVPSVFSEPQNDVTFATLEDAVSAASGAADATVFAVEYLPGQFDQRADSASECIQLITQEMRPVVKSATVYVLDGVLSDDDIDKIKHYVINPVEAREASLDMPQTLEAAFEIPKSVEVLEGFRDFDETQLAQFISARGLAMDLADIKFLQAYFQDEHRDPTITEVKMVDTYWSDHCRHTTFGTELKNISIDDDEIQNAFDHYLEERKRLGRADKPVTLMDMATIGARVLKDAGVLKNLDESEEINACTVKVKVDVRGEEQDWLYLFKNETHNHPTEIEPFGGAATCLGGAIRDPLSGRAYVYQAMRVTGAADPTLPVEETLAGKLPQRQLVTTAAEGYSSYGNQIGLATGQVSELYHPGYAAKRMEIGAVIGATPASDVVRETPAAGDVIVLLGGRTGRDGIGGATGSSKAHNAASIDTCGAEVQKGNPPVERKIQRLFRNSEACRMIKRCNDFGAGGVSVAIGELADGIEVDLDRVPKKYEGLDGTELAISESQERMAVALAANDVDDFIALARAENLEATPVAVVTEEPRVKMTWRGDTIVDVSREFLASNGAPKEADVTIGEFEALPEFLNSFGIDARKFVDEADLNTRGRKIAHSEEDMCNDYDFYTGVNEDAIDFERYMIDMLSSVNFASNKGLSERFDSTIGSATVLMPFGGKYQLTTPQAMVAKFPILGGETTTVSGLAWAFDPYMSEINPFEAAYAAVLLSIGKLIASGFERKNAYLTFQEYFEKLGDDPLRWGKVTAALLGAFEAQVKFGVAAIGGKDSMSGSFEDLNVPPTLVSFATATGDIDRVVSPEFKDIGSPVLRVKPAFEEAEHQVAVMDAVSYLIGRGLVRAASVVDPSGEAITLFNMCVGNRIGIELAPHITKTGLADMKLGTFILEMADGFDEEAVFDELVEHFSPDTEDARMDAEMGCVPFENGGLVQVVELGKTIDNYVMEFYKECVDLEWVQKAWESGIASVFPYRSETGEGAQDDPAVPVVSYEGGCSAVYTGAKIAQPRVVIPVFPGTNCEYDTQAAFERAGAKVCVQIINNLSPNAVRESTELLVRNIHESQIVMLPGGFSGGDEPDGSAKFITAFFRSPEVTEAVRDLLQNRDGLMLGICNGFQALVKLGLVPFGDIVEAKPDAPTLTFNNIGRHQSRLVDTRVASNLSPWLSKCEVGEIHTVAISHGEGRFVATPETLEAMSQRGQIATQYVDHDGVPSMDLDANPNGSVWAIEGITSPDGRVFGKMGHSERAGADLYKNVPGNLYQPIFEGGVGYFL